MSSRGFVMFTSLSFVLFLFCVIFVLTNFTTKITSAFMKRDDLKERISSHLIFPLFFFFGLLLKLKEGEEGNEKRTSYVMWKSSNWNKQWIIFFTSDSLLEIFFSTLRKNLLRTSCNNERSIEKTLKQWREFDGFVEVKRFIWMLPNA